MTVLASDVGLPSAWVQAHADARDRAISDAVPGGTQSLEVDVRYDDERWALCLAPVVVCRYVYDGRVWRVVVNGQSGVVHGEGPVDHARLRRAVVGLLAPGIGMVLAGAAGGVDGFVLLGAALVMSAAVVHFSFHK